MKEVARLAYCSEYHFKRMFSFLAAFELNDSEVKIIDLAVK